MALSDGGLLLGRVTSPVIKGTGEPLFRPASAGTLELLDTRAFAAGAVIRAYRPVTAG